MHGAELRGVIDETGRGAKILKRALGINETRLNAMQVR